MFAPGSYVVAIAAILLIVGVAAAVTLVLLRRREDAWKRFARRHRLRFESRGLPAGPRVFGMLDGRAFELTSTRSSSDSGLGLDEVRMSLALRAVPPASLEVAPRAPGADLVAESQVLTDDAAFDGAALVTAARADLALDFLTPRRRAALLRLLEDGAPALAGLRNGSLFVMERAATGGSSEQLERRLAVLRRAADDLDGYPAKSTL
ncbi:MAG: hypothetical protein KBD01_13215 [Acidobacteria bacterium]|nr:hypothetical protein [Acidobacteriota bacterium]